MTMNDQHEQHEQPRSVARQIADLVDAVDRQAAQRAQQDRITEMQADIDQLRDALDRAAVRVDEQNQELKQWHDSARTCVHQHATASTASAAATHTLDSVIQQMNDVVTLQLQLAIGAGSGAMRAVDIRRRQLAKYTPEHDQEHGMWTLVQFALAVAKGQRVALPNSMNTAQMRDWVGEIVERGNGEQFLHAAALLMAAYDVAQLNISRRERERSDDDDSA
jgi:hypothetical protein